MSVPLLIAACAIVHSLPGGPPPSPPAPVVADTLAESDRRVWIHGGLGVGFLSGSGSGIAGTAGISAGRGDLHHIGLRLQAASEFCLFSSDCAEAIGYGAVFGRHVDRRHVGMLLSVGPALVRGRARGERGPSGFRDPSPPFTTLGLLGEAHLGLRGRAARLGFTLAVNLNPKVPAGSIGLELHLGLMGATTPR